MTLAPMPRRARGNAASAPAIAGDDERGAAHQPIGGADNAVHSALAGPVPIVEHVFGIRVVHGDDGELQDFLLGHAAEANDAGGGFFRAADHVAEEILPLRMQMRDDIGAVVHREVRLVGDGRFDVPIVGLVVLALDGKGRDAFVSAPGRRRRRPACSEGWRRRGEHRLRRP